jgi:hypothetical protein
MLWQVGQFVYYVVPIHVGGAMMHVMKGQATRMT